MSAEAQCQHERRGYQELNTLPAYSWCLDCGLVFPPLVPSSVAQEFGLKLTRQ